MMEPYVYQSGEVYGEPERPMPSIGSRLPRPRGTAGQELTKAAARGAERRRFREMVDPHWHERTPEMQRMLLRQDAADARDLARRREQR